MKSLQKIITMLLLALALGSHDTTQTNILDLLEKYSDIPDLLPLEIKCKIAGYCSRSHMLQYLFKQAIIEHRSNVYIRHIMFSPDGNTIALKCTDFYELWTKNQNGLFAYSQLLTPYTLNAQINNICFSPDGNAIALELSNDTCEFWTKQNVKFVYQPPYTPNAKISCIEFSPDGGAVAIRPVSAYRIHPYEIWMKKQGGKFVFSQLLIPRFPNAKVSNITFSPDGNAIDLNLTDTHELWTKRDEEFVYQSLYSPNAKISNIYFSSEGDAINLDLKKDDNTYTQELWIKRDEEFVCQPPNTSNAKIRYIVFGFDSDFIVLNIKKDNDTYANELWTKNQDGEFVFSQFLISNIPHAYIEKIKLSSDGNIIVFVLKKVNNTRTCAIWTKEQDGQFVFSQLSIPYLPNAKISNITFSPDGNAIDLDLKKDDNTYTHELWIQQQKGQLFYQPPHTSNAKIIDIKFSLDGNCIALKLKNKTWELWNKQNGLFAYSQLITPKSYNPPTTQIRDILFSPDGNTIALELSKMFYELWTKKQDGQFDYQPSNTLAEVRRNDKWHSLFPGRSYQDAQISRIKFISDGSFIALKLSSNRTCEIWESGTKKLRKGKLTIDQRLFIELLLAMQKKYLSTSLALVAHYCQKQGLNITLKELEDIFYSFEEEERTYLERLFNIVEPKLYRKLAKLDPDLTEEKIRFIQLLRGYKILMASIQLQKVSLGEFVSYYLNHHFEKQIVLNKPMNVYQSLYIFEIFKSFSEEAQQFLKSKYGLHEQTSLASHTDQPPSSFCSIS